MAERFDDDARRTGLRACVDQVGPSAGHTHLEGSHVSIDPKAQVDDAELKQHGITRVPADAFLWGGYRYTNASDALAAAKRGKAT
jgi:hypothetical protein